MATAPIDILAVLRRAGLIDLAEEPPAEPLTGGVSSDIWHVMTAGGDVCVKRALPKLKVRADWRVPVERSRFETRWLQDVAEIAPDAVPHVLQLDVAAGALVLSYLEPAGHRCWKDELRAGRVDPGVAAAVGRVLVRIHAATARRDEMVARYPSDALFHELRLAPYLLAAAAAHPQVEQPLRRLARRTATTKLALVHGDVSPKNILIGPTGRPVIVDAECACYGDPAFDLAFCLNHLLLKCLWVPGSVEPLMDSFDGLTEAYMGGVVWERRPLLEARAAGLLPGLMLARVDGKSPLEYLTEPHDKERVRSAAMPLLLAPPSTLEEVRAAWLEALRS